MERDWYPLSASGPFSDLKDTLDGVDAQLVGDDLHGVGVDLRVGRLDLLQDGDEGGTVAPELVGEVAHLPGELLSFGD